MKAMVRTLSWLILPAFVPTASAANPDQTALAQKAAAVLKTHCYRCHGQEGANEGGFNYDLDQKQLIKRKKVVPGNSGKSRLFQRVVSNDEPMPPAATIPPGPRRPSSICGPLLF
jgi:mono/diheme cytochrome c family protein